jgi:UDP-GlcNAc3NAcA epimerase
MYDNAIYYSQLAESGSNVLNDLKLNGKNFVLCTIHRDSNTDSADRLSAIMASLDKISRDKQIEFILPLHPRTIKMLPLMLAEDLKDRLDANPFLRMSGPVTYFDMLMLEKNCRMIITDSGGVQKESYFFRKPCLVLRSESEWKN